MLKQLFNMPYDQHFYIACSGGVDSMAVADFYMRGNKNFSLAYFHHNTLQADKMQEFVIAWGKKNNREVIVNRLTEDKQKNNSPEEFWRKARYNWFNSLNGDVITCHHLNDVAETWIFSSLNGNPKLIKSSVNNIRRPFLISSKQEMIDWCIKNKVEWLEDISNQDTHYPRNRIRHNILPEALKVNPGLLKVLKKKVLNEKF